MEKKIVEFTEREKNRIEWKNRINGNYDTHLPLVNNQYRL